MSTPGIEAIARVGTAVAGVVERVFGTVTQVQAAAAVSVEHRGLRPGAAVLPAGTGELLRDPGQLAVGLGLVVAPRAAAGLPLRLEWWQVDPAGGQVRALQPDLRPTSLGYYDYTATAWFDVPRRTGRRHVVGPYVDVHGTGSYLLTLTAPVHVGGDFVGVAGADVPARRFESHVLQALGTLAEPFVLLDDEGRVVLSTAPELLVGSLRPTTAGSPADGVALAGVPWRLLLVPGLA